MIRWLKIIRAELVRDLTTSLRYPLEVFFGLFILYVLFMGLFMGAKTLAGGQALSGNLDGLVVGYCMWFFAMLAINTMSIELENEARQGTLEQVCLHAPSFLGVLWVRSSVHVCLGAGMVVVLALLIQVTTGNYLSVSPGIIGPVIAAVVLTVAGLAGFGLVLGALSLLFKRIGQLSALVQFSLFFLAYTDLQAIAEPWRSWLPHLPLARGVGILKLIFAGGIAGEDLLNQLFLLAFDSAGYVVLGSLFFLWMDRIARRGGLLAHY